MFLLIIFQVGDDLYITNAKSISSNCNGAKTSYKIPEVGLVEMKMVCACSFEVDNINIYAPIHCSKDKMELRIAVPNVWASNDANIQGNLYSNADNILNDNWTL